MRLGARLRFDQASADKPLANGLPFALLVMLTLFTFLNIPNRFKFVGAARPTVILVVLLVLCVIANWPVVKRRLAVPEARQLAVLIAYILLSLPLVAYPGSVIRKKP